MSQADSKNSSGQEKLQTAQSVPYTYPYPQQFEDDAIDLYELWITLWNRKWLIIAVTVVTVLGSVVYALQLRQIYKVEALLLPPKAKDIQSMNVRQIEIRVDGGDISFGGDTNIDGLIMNVFTKFTQNLKSRNIQKKFIQENGLLELLAPRRTPETRIEEIHSVFARLIKLEDENGITSLSIEMHDAEIAAQWVNDLVEFVDKETITMLAEDARNSISNQIRDIEYAIASKRQMAKQRREDLIVRYDEAAKIAENLGIKRRVDATNIIQNTQMNLDIATAATPLYYLGHEALMTEISILKNRETDDPFISGLRDLQEKLALLRSITFDQEKMTAVYIDQAAYPSKYPIKPNRRLIVSLATVAGLFSGVLLTLFIEFVQNKRKNHSE